MGSSLNLRGGTSVAKTLVDSISQSAHGFAVADVVRYDTTTSRYRKAIANSAENSEVVGIVSAVADSNSFDLVYNGYVYLPSLSGASAPVQFLSGTTAGEVTTNPPSAIGTVIKPVLTKNTSGGGYIFINYLGTQIGGSSTVAIDQIQPVGSIIPYAGGVIPETWLACDGASYAIGDYSELYTKLQYTTGSRTPMYGYVANITVGNSTAYAVGQAVSQASPGLSGTVLSLNGTTAAGSGTITLTVQTIPTYSATNKNFTNQNAQFVANISNNISIAGVLSTISAVTNTHFNTPDLRGRFAMGVNTTTIADAETDATYQSGISNIYTLGSEGGEEQHILSVAEMPGHGHSAPTWTGVTGTTGTYEVATSYPYALSYDYIGSAPTSIVGSNTPHNNIPPYVVTQYIIKAKPYTRAAIIDGVDIPYNQLLVRDMRSESIGGASGSDLVFYTNSGEADKLGTERMRLYNNGDLELLGDRNTARNRLFIKSTFNTFPGQTLNDDSYLESQKQDGTPVGNFGFNGWSLQSLRYTDFQIATRGVTDTEVNRRIYIDREGNIQMGGWIGLTGGATGNNSRVLTVTTTGDLYNDWQDKTYVSGTGVTGGALRLAANPSYSIFANNQYYDPTPGQQMVKRSRAGGSSMINLWSTNDALGSRIDFLFGGTGAKDSNITAKLAMNISGDGSIVLGNDNYGVISGLTAVERETKAVSRIISTHKMHLGIPVGGTSVGDCWALGTIEMPNDWNSPVNVKITHACHHGGANESAVFEFVTDYNSPAAVTTFVAGSTTAQWKQIPSVQKGMWETNAFTTIGSNFAQLDSAFCIDMRKTRMGPIELRLRACYAGIQPYGSAATTTNLATFLIETTGTFTGKFVPANTSSTIAAPVAGTAQSASNPLSTAVAGYVGKRSYEFPVAIKGMHEPTASGLFISSTGCVYARNYATDHKMIIQGYGDGLGYGIVFQPQNDGNVATPTTHPRPLGFVNAAGIVVGSVHTTSSTTAYNTTSDHRLKTNVLPLTDALSKVSKLNPISFVWKINNQSDIGFIAHELGEIVPQATYGEKDAVNADGSINPQMVDSNKIISLLTAAIKELKVIVDTQSAEITALKSKMSM